MTWLMESPTTIIGAVVLTEFVLVAILLRTGRVKFIGAMFIVGVLGLALLFTERMVVTDREAIRSTLDGAAHAMMTNDPGKPLAFVDPEALELQNRVRMLFNRVTFKEAHVGGDYEVTLRDGAAPPTATVTFLARARIQEKTGADAIGREEVMVPVSVDLKKIDGHWKIENASDKDHRF